MKKLRMDLDELRVESFATEHDPAGAEGTVWGHQDAMRPKPGTAGCYATKQSCHYSCHGGACSFESCPGTCPMGGTCHETCGIRCIDPGPPQLADTLIGWTC